VIRKNEICISQFRDREQARPPHDLKAADTYQEADHFEHQSPDLLSDKEIGGEEVLILIPGYEDTQVQIAYSQEEIRALLECGLSIADGILPISSPQKALSSWAFELGC